MYEEETIDSLLEEACKEEEEIEEGYFTENLKYLLDKDIDNDIDSTMGSIFNSDSTTTVELTVNCFLDELQEEILNSTDSEYAKAMIEDSPEVKDAFSELEEIERDKYDCEHDHSWCDEDDESDDFNIEIGDYNPGYDAIFGDGS